MWVRIEQINGDYADRHFPTAPDVQLYRKNEGATFWSSNFSVPTTPDGDYSGWSKQSQSARNDWSDVETFSNVWQDVAAPHFTGANPGDIRSGAWNQTAISDEEVAGLSTVADLDQMARWLAVMTILNNNEHNLSNGYDNDYGGAFVSDGVNRRLQLIPHDLDNLLGKGDSSNSATEVGLFAMTQSGQIFTPLLPLIGTSSVPGNAAFRTKYFNAIRELYGTIFDADTAANPYPPFHQWIDNHLGNWVPETARAQLKTHATARQGYLLGLIGQPKITPAAATSNPSFTATASGNLRLNEIFAANTSTHAVSGSYPDVIELHNTGGGSIALAGYTIADASNSYTFPAGLCLNEWAGNTRYRLSDDFVEIHNPAGSPAALGGMRVSDDIASYPSRHVFPPLSFIGAGGYLALTDNDRGFGLDGQFETVWLTGANGTTVDRVDLIAQHADTSSGRLPNGGTAWADFAVPSPGLANGANTTGYEELLESLRITEIMYAPNGGGDYEFVELQNIGTTTLNLGGVRFSTGISYTFAAGVTLAAGDYLVVCKNRSAFLARYPSASSKLAAGTFTGSLDNSGETIALTLPSPWAINILRFRYEPWWFATTLAGGRSLVTLDQAVTPPADWGRSQEWLSSSAVHGSPGAAGGIVGDAFSYLIVATRSPDSFGAGGLPPGLAVDPESGLISGVPEQTGTFQVTLTASYDQAGTDPSSAASVFAFTGHGMAGSDFQLTWSCVAGKTYRVKASTNLQSWTTVETRTAAASGTLTAIMQVAPGESRFFRVEVVP